MGSSQHKQGLIKEIEACKQSDFNCYHFPYDIKLQRYDMSSYRPEYSGGMISEDQCDMLVKDCNKYLSPLDYPYPYGLLLPLGLLASIALMLLLYYLLVYFEYRSIEELSSAKLRDNLIGGYLIGMLGFFVFVGVIVFELNRVPNMRGELPRLTKAIVKRHAIVTFAGNKDVKLKISDSLACISILYDWTRFEDSMNQIHSRGQRMQDIVPVFDASSSRSSI